MAKQPSEFGIWVKQQRLARHWSQTMLCQKASKQSGGRPYSQSSITDLETGKSQFPNGRLMQALEKLFGPSPRDAQIPKPIGGGLADLVAVVQDLQRRVAALEDRNQRLDDDVREMMSEKRGGA